ncbi:MAG: hypothetical protein U1E70_07345 [Acetobacteraceae bacterium]
MTPGTTSGDRGAWWATLGLLCLALLAPLLVVDLPPLLDYPNHLGRLFVLARLPDDPVLARFYAAQWAIIPNLALDLIGPSLIRVLPVHDAGRLLIGAAVLLPVLGCVAYSATLGGRWWSLAVGLAAYNRTVLEGFLNFNIGIGLALLLAACWMRWRTRHPAWVTLAAMLSGVVLFACHLMAVALFIVLVGADEAIRLLRGRRGTAAFAWAGVRMALIVALPLALYAMSALQALGGDLTYSSVADKAAHLMAPFINYAWPLDVLTGVFALGCPLVCLLLGRGRLAPQAWVAVPLLFGAYLAAPYGWKGTYQIDTRFAIMLGALLFAGFMPVRWPRWLGRGVATAAVLLFTGRMALLTQAWWEHRADLADLRAALAAVQAGQAIYVVLAQPEYPEGYDALAPWSRHLSDGVFTGTHLGALALIEHRAWWPFQFDNASQQPIRTLEPYRTLALGIGDLPDQRALAKADLCGFDVVLVLQADGVAPLPDARFRPLAGQGFARSYAVGSCGASG